jgi:hypothetical protein
MITRAEHVTGGGNYNQEWPIHGPSAGSGFRLATMDSHFTASLLHF